MPECGNAIRELAISMDKLGKKKMESNGTSGWI
jgi:hypothetical protein